MKYSNCAVKDSSIKYIMLTTANNIKLFFIFIFLLTNIGRSNFLYTPTNPKVATHTTITCIILFSILSLLQSFFYFLDKSHLIIKFTIFRYIIAQLNYLKQCQINLNLSKTIPLILQKCLVPLYFFHSF